MPNVHDDDKKAKQAAAMRAWRKANPEKSKAKQKAYRDANRERLLAARRADWPAYYEKHKEKLIARSVALNAKKREARLAYQEANKERLEAERKAKRVKSQIEYLRRNPENKKKWAKASYERHKPAIMAKTKLYMRKRYAEDPVFALTRRLRYRTWWAVKRQGGKKSAKTLELIGCTALELRAHLESQFSEGMTWDNAGKWHIDHKRPCISFDLTDPAQQRQCFHYTNLQPLWAVDNMKKGRTW